MVTKKYITYQDIEQFIQDLISYLDEHKIKPTGVYGIPRGGLFFALLLSYRLDIPMLLAPTEGCVVIDDIADTGKTLAHFTKNETQFNKYFIATMFYNRNVSVVEPDFYWKEKLSDWICFPYEGSNAEIIAELEKRKKEKK